VLELLKLITDLFVMRDSAQKGMLSWRGVLFGFGFAIFLFATGVPAANYYDRHAEARTLFLFVVGIDALAFILFMIFGTRWYLRGMARYRAEQAAKGEAADAS
jgi:hypothetical protein